MLPGAGVVLLGELGKFAAVSTYRFGGISVGQGGGLGVVLRGNIGEEVALQVVRIVGYGKLGPCETRRFSLQKNGETDIVLN